MGKHRVARSISILISLAVALAIRARPSEAQQPTIIARAAGPTDSTRSDSRASIVIAVRDVDRPAVPLSEVTAYVRPSSQDSLTPSHVRRLRLTGAYAVLVNAAPGEYVVRVLRVGFSPYSVPIRVATGCELHVEVYLSRNPSCLLRCEATPPRSTVTTCSSAKS
jgi:hypothetical protein